MQFTYLERIVAMIPGGTILQRLELVCVCVLSGNRTLSRRHTIHLVSVELSNTMPVNCSAHVWQKIPDMYYDGITPACFKLRTWICAIEGHHGFLNTIGTESSLGHI